MNVRIQTRIILPFLGLFVLSQALVAWFGIRAVSREVEQQISDTLKNVATMISRAGFPLNAPSLERIKSVIGYDVAVSSSAGRLVASSLPAEEVTEFEAWLARPVEQRERAGDFFFMGLRGERYWVAMAGIQPRPGSGSGESTLLLLHAQARVTEAKWKAVRPIAVVLALSLAGLTLLGFCIAHTIAAPIRDLAEQAREVAQSGLDRQVAVTTKDEVGELARSFNQMLACLRESQAKAVEAGKMASLGQLAAGIAHEIRNPLSSLRMTAQLLERRLPEDEKVREPLRVIREEIDRLDLALSEVLSYARPRPPQMAEVRLDELVDSVLQLMSRQLEHAHVRVHLEGDRPFPGVMADAGQLKQVLVNLVLNAMQGMPGGGDLTLRARSAGGSIVRLEVVDTGKGIPEEIRAKVFQPFFTTREGGAGLGLSLSRRIVEQHGGRIDFETSPSGSCFWIELQAKGINHGPNPAH